MLNIVPNTSETGLFSFYFFPLCYSASVICSALRLPCYLPVHLNILLPQLLCYWFPLVYFFFISLIALFIVDSLFFISPMSLLNTSCIFSIHASILFIYASILLPRFWFIFTIIPLNSFSNRHPISSSFVWCCGFLPCSFIWCMFCCFVLLLFHFIYCVWGLSPDGCKAAVPLNFEVCPQWVGFDQPLVKVSW